MENLNQLYPTIQQQVDNLDFFIQNHFPNNQRQIAIPLQRQYAVNLDIFNNISTTFRI